VETLIKLMHDGRGNASWSAAQSLAIIGGPGLKPVFEAAHDRNPALQEMAANCFMELRDRRATPLLIGVLNSPNLRIREMALFRLSMWKDERALPDILKMTADPDMERRRLAIGMLYEYDDVRHPEIIPPLLAAMTDSHEWVRSQAAGALFGKRDKRIEPAMEALVHSPIKDVPGLARMVLRQLP
jgi:HEAT repeat protein